MYASQEYLKGYHRKKKFPQKNCGIYHLLWYSSFVVFFFKENNGKSGAEWFTCERFCVSLYGELWMHDNPYSQKLNCTLLFNE